MPRMTHPARALLTRAGGPHHGVQTPPSSVRSCLGWPLPCFFHVHGYRPFIYRRQRQAYTVMPRLINIYGVIRSCVVHRDSKGLCRILVHVLCSGMRGWRASWYPLDEHFDPGFIGTNICFLRFES